MNELQKSPLTLIMLWFCSCWLCGISGTKMILSNGSRDFRTEVQHSIFAYTEEKAKILDTEASTQKLGAAVNRLPFLSTGIKQVLKHTHLIPGLQDTRSGTDQTRPVAQQGGAAAILTTVPHRGQSGPFQLLWPIPRLVQPFLNSLSKDCCHCCLITVLLQFLSPQREKSPFLVPLCQLLSSISHRSSSHEFHYCPLEMSFSSSILNKILHTQEQGIIHIFP